ncbi:hypothetical protein C0Q70_03652 [Pomacea canaliculata]|uniref:CIDE-N domain-containing protein n=1 Tax=Pomacea canaliculata TaxID=400727 RepID=A0A2T7PTB4_POMCA|nr:DNA fragmentation factor subunit beta-like [Pomacea canaliculata]PVD36666.1 hypothetical protein C0Q70_03652 [Pomacea canaliculata]
MWNTFLSLFNGGVRAYKVQSADRGTRVGVTARSLEDLVRKGREKLKIADNETVTVVIEDDGTEVDNEGFFKNLPQQTVFVFLRKGERWKGVGDLVYDVLSKFHDNKRRAELASEIREMLTDESAPEKVSLMSQYLDMLETHVEAEQRYEHEDWFDGLNKKYKTKSDVMRNSAQQRIRSYFVTAKEQIQRERDEKSRADLLEMMDEIYVILKSNDFHASYFDRTAKPQQRMCDKEGWFRCRGAFDVECCLRLHTINPYASRGYRLLFGLWNLDHIVEKSREVMPTLLEAARTKRLGSKLNWHEVYRLLFTQDNLRLVHVACHKKAARLEKTCHVTDFIVH